MAIKYAILGLLSWQPFTGYDLKKVFTEQTILYWSGNNNQIYKTLVQLLEEGLVTNEVQPQEHLPAKKVYSITEKGQAELRKWVLSDPEPPDLRKTFLIQLAWSDQLAIDELDSLLASYENEIDMQVRMEKEKVRRGLTQPGRSPREAYIWEMISENIVMSYESELEWVRKIRRGVKNQSNFFKGGIGVNCRLIETNGIKYVEGPHDGLLISDANDAVGLVSYCGEHDTNRVLLYAANFHEDFFNLKTGLAGAVLQKFVNYGIKAAAVIPSELANEGRFGEMVLEANRGQHFRVFGEAAEAESWLIEH